MAWSIRETELRLAVEPGQIAADAARFERAQAVPSVEVERRHLIFLSVGVDDGLDAKAAGQRQESISVIARS